MNKNAQSAQETMNAYTKEVLKDLPTKTKYFPQNVKLNDIVNGKHNTKTFVNNENCVNRVFQEAYKGFKTGIMNFASPIVPGGGFLNGANAQEEAICRGSFLYPELKKQPKYYEVNKNIDYNKSTIGLIYSEQVKFIKAEIQNIERFVIPVFADVVTVAAPHGDAMNSSHEENEQELYNKMEQTLIQFKNHGVQSIILGAFGCGVFNNNPFKVAYLFKKLLNKPEFKNSFHRVTFSTFSNNINAFTNFGSKTTGDLDLEIKLIEPVETFEDESLDEMYEEVFMQITEDSLIIHLDSITEAIPEISYTETYQLIGYLQKNSENIIKNYYVQMKKEEKKQNAKSTNRK